METARAIEVLAPRGYCVHEDTLLRHVRMEPYSGSTFDLVTWDTGRWDRRGCAILGYALFSSESEDPIFHGEDASPSPSPMDAIDSDAATRGILVFLALRPGDTDPEYFARYTAAQHAFADTHAEAVSMYAMCEDAIPWDADLLEH